MAYSDVKVTKVTSGNNYDISTHFTSGYTNTPSPYGTITITPKDGFTVENDLPVKVWVSYKSNGVDCGTKEFDFTIPGSGGGGGCNCTNVSYSTTSLSWPNGGTTPQSVTITPPNGCTISELSGRLKNNQYFTTAITSSNKISVTPNNVSSGPYSDELYISFKFFS